MDWTVTVMITAITATTGLVAGLGGAAIAGHFMVKAQKVAQREENIRHTRKVTYDAALREWSEYMAIVQRDIDCARSKSIACHAVPFPVFDDWLIHRISLAEALAEIDISNAGSEVIIPIINRLRVRTEEIKAFRKTLEKEIRQAKE